MTNLMCTICIDCIKDGSTPFVTKCGHVYHATCLLKWRENSTTCPDCRVFISIDQCRRMFLKFSTCNGNETMQKEECELPSISTLVSEWNELRTEFSEKAKRAKKVIKDRTQKIAQMQEENRKLQFDFRNLFMQNQKVLRKNASEKQSLMKSAKATQKMLERKISFLNYKLEAIGEERKVLTETIRLQKVKIVNMTKAQETKQRNDRSKNLYQKE